MCEWNVNSSAKLILIDFQMNNEQRTKKNKQQVIEEEKLVIIPISNIGRNIK